MLDVQQTNLIIIIITDYYLHMHLDCCIVCSYYQIFFNSAKCFTIFTDTYGEINKKIGTSLGTFCLNSAVLSK